MIKIQKEKSTLFSFFIAVILLVSAGCRTTPAVSKTPVAQSISDSENTKEPAGTGAVIQSPVPTSTTAVISAPENTTAISSAATASASETKEATKTSLKTTTMPKVTAQDTSPAATETSATTLPPETTADPISSYADTAEIRQLVIDKLTARGQYDPEYVGEHACGGEKWWGIGYYENAEQYSNAFIDGKFTSAAGITKRATSIICWIENDQIHLKYQGFFIE